jgi:hypothetical protein
VPVMNIERDHIAGGGNGGTRASTGTHPPRRLMEMTLLRIHFDATRKVNNCQRYQIPFRSELCVAAMAIGNHGSQTLRTHLLPSCFNNQCARDRTSHLGPANVDSLQNFLQATGDSSGTYSAASYAERL